MNEEQQTELSLRTTDSRLRFLAHLGDALRALEHAGDIQKEASVLLAQHLHASGAYLAEIDGQDAVVNHGYAEDVPPPVGRFMLRELGLRIAETLASGRVAVWTGIPGDPTVMAAVPGSISGPAMRAYIAAPLLRGAEWGALLVVYSANPREWRREEVALVEDAAERTWTAVERARAEEALHRSEQLMQRLNDELEERVRDRTAELRQANAALQLEGRDRGAAQEEVKALIQRLVSTQEEERRRIAREIHDQLGQYMTALRMNLEALTTRVADTAASELAVRTQSLAAALDESIDFVTLQLRPAALDHFGLPASLHSLVNGWSKRFGIRSELDTSGVDGMRLAPDVEANLYRIAQEALHNVFKHAGASQVSIFLGRQGNKLVLMIEDNGRGFDPGMVDSHHRNTFGVLGMRERATLVGGELEIESLPGQGTTVVVRGPVLDHTDGATNAN